MLLSLTIRFKLYLHCLLVCIRNPFINLIKCVWSIFSILLALFFIYESILFFIGENLVMYSLGCSFFESYFVLGLTEDLYNIFHLDSDVYSSVRDGGRNRYCKSVLGEENAVSKASFEVLFQMEVLQSGGSIRFLHEEVVRREFISGPIFEPKVVGCKYLGLFGTKYEVLKTPSREELSVMFSESGIFVPESMYRPTSISEFNKLLFYSGYSYGFDEHVSRVTKGVILDFKNSLVDKGLLYSNEDPRIRFNFHRNFYTNVKLILEVLKFLKSFDNIVQCKLSDTYREMVSDLIPKLYSLGKLSNEDKLKVAVGTTSYEYSEVPARLVLNSGSLDSDIMNNQSKPGFSINSKKFNKLFMKNISYKNTFNNSLPFQDGFKEYIEERPLYDHVRGYPKSKLSYIIAIKASYTESFPKYDSEKEPLILELISTSKEYYYKGAKSAEVVSNHLEAVSNESYYYKFIKKHFIKQYISN